jgi:hypothetical protein
MILTSLALAVSGFWITLETSGPDWFVKDRQPFFSFGVDCVDTGDDPAKETASYRSYSALKVFPDERTWARTVQSQLRSWGFNSLGAWSDVETFRKWCGDDRLPYAVCLHLGAYDKAPWNDLFSDEMVKAMDGAARDQIPHYRDDPFLIGYFSDNELGWWDDTLFETYLHMKPNAPGRIALNGQLWESYHGSMALLKKDWITSASSIEGITDLKLRPGGDGRRVVKQWAGYLATQYYRLAHDLIRKYDHNHLILGDRYCQYYSVPIVMASAPFVDVASTNLGADWNDGTLSPFFLATLHSLTGRPVMVTEFYMTAMENRSGNRNTSDGFPVVQTQKERAAAFGRYVKTVAGLPYVVGAHWFQYADEPSNGRGDGENYNMGLVDIHGVPYDEITTAAKEIDVERVHAKAVESTVKSSVPSDPLAGLKDWDRARSWVRPTTPNPVADLYVLRRPEGLYVGLYSMDYADKSLYPNDRVPEVDRCRLRLWFSNRKEPIDVRFGDDRAPVETGWPGVQVRSSGGLKATTILFIPKAKSTFRARFDSHGRAESAEWRADAPYGRQ